MITIKTPQEIRVMREGGKLLAKALRTLKRLVKPGMTTIYIDKLARELVLSYAKKYPEAQITPAFLGYKNYPAAICTSVNEEVVHCVPSERKLCSDDILSLDFGIVYHGWNLDSAITFPLAKKRFGLRISTLAKETARLLRVTKECLVLGIREARPGGYVGDIGYAIYQHASKHGFGVVRELVGHGIGRNLHEEPQVPNYGIRGKGERLSEGMVIAIEPMLTLGNEEVEEKGFTFRTKDKSLAAHFEHTVAITAKGPYVLTR